VERRPAEHEKYDYNFGGGFSEERKEMESVCLPFAVNNTSEHVFGIRIYGYSRTLGCDLTRGPRGRAHLGAAHVLQLLACGSQLDMKTFHST
jgi:hypothetical protein